MELRENMCELIGAIIGDGNIYDKKPYYVQLTGHPSEDFTYFKEWLVPIIKNELDYIPRIYFYQGAVIFRINNKKFVSFLKSLGIPTGKFKSKNVLIPKIICNSWKKTKNCIRGIFDTDGSIYFDKRAVYSKPYPRVELHMSNLGLLEQLYSILKKHEFNVTISKKKSCIYLNGFKETRKFLTEIGFANPKHHRRIKRLYPNLITFNLI